jgi:hypothetical protein
VERKAQQIFAQRNCPAVDAVNVEGRMRSPGASARMSSAVKLLCQQRATASTGMRMTTWNGMIFFSYRLGMSASLRPARDGGR